MEDRFSVRLTGPAKVEGKWRKAGEDVDVTPELAHELAAAGVIPQGDAQVVAELASGMPTFDEAVAATAKVLAEDAIGPAVEAATAELIAERDAALARSVEAEAQRDLLQERVLELQAEVAALKTPKGPVGDEKPAGDASQDNLEPAPPTGTAAKPARKAVTQKG